MWICCLVTCGSVRTQVLSLDVNLANKSTLNFSSLPSHKAFLTAPFLIACNCNLINATCNCLRSYLWIHFTTFFEWSLLSAQYHGLWLPETALQKYMKGCFNNVHSRSYSLWLWCLLNNYQRLTIVRSICDFSTRCCSFDVNGWASIQEASNF